MENASVNPGRRKVEFDYNTVKQGYEQSNYQYNTLAKKLKVHKDTLLKYLKKEGLYRPNTKIAISKPKGMRGIEKPTIDRNTSKGSSVMLRELSDLEDYAQKWKRVADEEESARRKLEKQNAELQRKIDTWEEKKEIEIEQIRAQHASQSSTGLAGLTNPDVVGKWAELAGHIVPMIQNIRGGGGNAGVIDGPNADTINMVANIIKTLDPETTNQIGTLVQVYAAKEHKALLNDLYNRLVGNVK